MSALESELKQLRLDWMHFNQKVKAYYNNPSNHNKANFEYVCWKLKQIEKQITIIRNKLWQK